MVPKNQIAIAPTKATLAFPNRASKAGIPATTRAEASTANQSIMPEYPPSEIGAVDVQLREPFLRNQRLMIGGVGEKS